MTNILKYLIGFALPITSFAIDSGWHYSAGNTDPNAQFHDRFPAPFYDDVTADQEKENTPLTPQQKHQALVWGLNESQEKRYVQLMQNRSGLYYKNRQISPVEVLGINARDDQERANYANLFASQEAMHLAKELAFTTGFNHAYSDLMAQYQLPVLRPFDVSKYSPYSYEPVDLQPHDQLMLFIHLKDSVRPIVNSLMAMLIKVPDTQLNIYFAENSNKNSDIQHWAQLQDIPPSMVSSKSITLNSGIEKYSTLLDQQKLPALFLIRAGKTTAINLDKF